MALPPSPADRLRHYRQRAGGNPSAAAVPDSNRVASSKIQHSLRGHVGIGDHVHCACLAAGRWAAGSNEPDLSGTGDEIASVNIRRYDLTSTRWVRRVSEVSDEGCAGDNLRRTGTGSLPILVVGNNDGDCVSSYRCRTNQQR